MSGARAPCHGADCGQRVCSCFPRRLPPLARPPLRSGNQKNLQIYESFSYRTNTATAMSSKQRLVLSIIDFLNQSIDDGTIKQDDKESLEVASASSGLPLASPPSHLLQPALASWLL